MRWTLLTVFGAVVALVGIAGLGVEIAHGNDIWRRGNGGIAPFVLGGSCVWQGLSHRGSEASSKPLWPALLWLAAIIAIGTIVYLLAPPLAFLYALLVTVIVRLSLTASWITRE